ncbi:hypothetical protein A2U01_0110671, partial [Trifolium medium]|nr:hypothetical protein [Trifolium medium]
PTQLTTLPTPPPQLTPPPTPPTRVTTPPAIDQEIEDDVEDAEYVPEDDVDDVEDVEHAEDVPLPRKKKAR